MVNGMHIENWVKKGIPIILLTHLSANLNNWDPRIIMVLLKAIGSSHLITWG